MTARQMIGHAMSLFAASLTPLLLLLAAANASIAAFEKATLLSNFNCVLDDSECLKKYLQEDVFARFGKGFPEFGVKPFDPLHFDDLSFNYEVGPAIKVTLNHTNAILQGLSRTKVIDVRTQLTGSSFALEASVSIPKLFYEGSYTCNGEWLLFPVEWSGKFNMTMGDISNTYKLTANLVNKGEGTFLDLEDFSFDFKVNAFNTHASGLFWGNEELNNFALIMTNKYWRGFIDVMWKLAQPDVLNKVSDAISTIMSKTPVKGLSSNQLPLFSGLKSVSN